MTRTDRDELLLNQVAQCVISVQSAKEWFAQLDDDYQEMVLRKLAVMIQQASSTKDDVKNAIQLPEVRETGTAAVLLSRGRLLVQLAKVVGLPRRQRAEGFVPMVATFRVADTRRRVTRCLGQCTHWWHRDLSDPVVVADLIGGRSN
jgi:hypothetical protein